jgi:hypothetical protein
MTRSRRLPRSPVHPAALLLVAVALWVLTVLLQH